MEEICRREPLSRCGRTHGLKLATGGAWMSAWVPRAGGCRLRSGSAQPFGLRATLVGWTVGRSRVVRPLPLF